MGFGNNVGFTPCQKKQPMWRVSSVQDHFWWYRGWFFGIGFTTPHFLHGLWVAWIQVGEYTAAVVAGTMSLEEGLRLVARQAVGVAMEHMEHMGWFSRCQISREHFSPILVEYGCFMKPWDPRPLVYKEWHTLGNFGWFFVKNDKPWVHHLKNPWYRLRPALLLVADLSCLQARWTHRPEVRHRRRRERRANAAECCHGFGDIGEFIEPLFYLSMAKPTLSQSAWSEKKKHPQPSHTHTHSHKSLSVKTHNKSVVRKEIWSTTKAIQIFFPKI